MNLRNKVQCKYDGRCIINDTLSRISLILKDVKIIEKIVMSTQLPYIFTTNPIPLEFEYQMTDSLFKETYSKFAWALFNKTIPSVILLSFNLTENTLEKNILLIFEIDLLSPELIQPIYLQKIKTGFPQICCEIIQNFIKELQENKKSIYHYESKVLNYPREKIWDIISNIHCYMNKEGMINECTKHVPIKEKGEEFSFFLGEKCNKKLCKLKFNKFKKDPDCNKWVMGYLPIEGPFHHSENFWTLIKLGDNQTMVGNTTVYSEPVSPEALKKLSESKMEMFVTIETLLETGQNKDMKCSCEYCKNKKNKDENGNNSD